MENTISMIISVKASAAKHVYNPLLGDKNLGIDPYIRLYELEDSDKTELVE